MSYDRGPFFDTGCEYPEFRLPNAERFFEWSSRVLGGDATKEAIEAKSPEFLAYFKQLGERIVREALQGPFVITEEGVVETLQLS